MEVSKAYGWFRCAAGMLWIAVSTSAGASTVPWQVPEAPYRLTMTLAPTTEPLESEPLIVTGETLYRLTGVPQVRAASLIVIGPGGKPTLSQVDERNADGQYLMAGDGRFDARDELVFTVNQPARRPAAYQLYFDTRPATPQPLPQPTVNKASTLVMDNGRLRFEIRGPGVEPYEQGRPDNFARGALAWLQFDEMPVTNIHSNWAFYLFGHPYGSGPGSTQWTPPRLLVDGPVRQIAETSIADLTAKDDAGQVVFQASATHFFCLYRGSPTLDLIEVANLVESPRGRADVYSFPFMVGGSTDAHDVLYVPVAGKIRTRSVREFAGQTWSGFYNAVLPDEGWLAWFDTAKRHGMALFFERQAVLDACKRWVSYRPVENTTVRVRSNLAEVWSQGSQTNPGVENTVTVTNRSVVPPETMERSFRLQGFRTDGAESIQRRYRLWGMRLEEVAKAGPPEAKSGR